MAISFAVAISIGEGDEGEKSGKKRKKKISTDADIAFRNIFSADLFSSHTYGHFRWLRGERVKMPSFARLCIVGIVNLIVPTILPI